MSTTGPDPRSGDSHKVRLSWPGQPAREPSAEPVSPTPRAEPWEATGFPLTDEGTVLRPVALVEEAATSALRRSIVDAYDRLSERIMQRLREVREDMDGDLSELRSEMSALRQAVDEVGDRVQLRQIRASVDELRTDVAGLRRAVLEWPELERVSSDITGLRADFADVAERVSNLVPRSGVPKLGSLSPIVEEVAAVRTEMASVRSVLDGLKKSRGDSDEVLGAIDELRAEVASLRRRISLRAGGHPDG